MKDAFTDGVKGSARQDHGLERLKAPVERQARRIGAAG
jgi:hypothetical protein